MAGDLIPHLLTPLSYDDLRCGTEYLLCRWTFALRQQVIDRWTTLERLARYDPSFRRINDVTFENVGMVKVIFDAEDGSDESGGDVTGFLIDRFGRDIRERIDEKGFVIVDLPTIDFVPEQHVYKQVSDGVAVYLPGYGMVRWGFVIGDRPDSDEPMQYTPMIDAADLAQTECWTGEIELPAAPPPARIPRQLQRRKPKEKS